ncbi:hypothetical protein FRC07_006763 [Ceratobasidium sp. 392]|nr:hypothetical protein FRC07_006763 [Ceratobasidium sp. 392]
MQKGTVQQAGVATPPGKLIPQPGSMSESARISQSDSVSVPTFEVSRGTMARSGQPRAAELSNTMHSTFRPSDISDCLRQVGAAQVLFGLGADVKQIFAGTQSPWVLILNLPRDVQEDDVRAFVASLPGLREVRMRKVTGHDSSPAASHVLFASHKEAKDAVSLLHGQLFFNQRIAVWIDNDMLRSSCLTGSSHDACLSLDGSTQDIHLEQQPTAVSIRGCTVKVSWYAPKTTLYMTYKDPRFALQQAKELNGRSFGNRRVETFALFAKRSNWARVAKEDGGFVIRLEGLWADLDADWESLCSFVRCRDIVVQPQYSHSTGIALLRESLSDIAPLETFKLLPHHRQDRKYHALAQYTTPSAATAAVKIFEGRRENYLGGSPVWVSRHLAIEYSIPVELVQAIQGQLNQLHSWSKDDPNLRVRQQHNPRKPGFVQVVLSSNETKLIAAAKARLDLALNGEPLRDGQGNKLWDSSFRDDAWTLFLDTVARRLGLFIRVDERTCSTLLFGPGYLTDEASGLIITEWTRLTKLKHTLDIPVALVGQFRTGIPPMLADLFDSRWFGIDLAQRSLTFHGDHEGAARVEQALDAMHNEVQPTLEGAMNCSTCLCPPEKPLSLDCGHRYCQPCFSQYLRSCTERRKLPMLCVGQDCNAPVSIPALLCHADPDDLDALLRTSFSMHVQTNPEVYKYCPTADCQYVYRVGERDTTVQCCFCLINICTYCRVEHHEGILCHDYLASHSEHEIQRSFDRWCSSRDVKRCPNCTTHIEKISGCNHMVCAVCRTHVCWVCMAQFQTSHQIYGHMRDKHGGIGL